MDQDAEATHSFVRAAPGRVFVRLLRKANDGTLVRALYTEFTPAEALQMARYLNECASIAIAGDIPAPAAPVAWLLTSSS